MRATAARLLRDGLEDRVGLGRGGDKRRDPPQRRLLGREQCQRLVRAGVEHHPDEVVLEHEQRARDRQPALAADADAPGRAGAGQQRPDLGRQRVVLETRPAWMPVAIVNAVLA